MVLPWVQIEWHYGPLVGMQWTDHSHQKLRLKQLLGTEFWRLLYVKACFPITFYLANPNILAGPSSVIPVYTKDAWILTKYILSDSTNG